MIPLIEASQIQLLSERSSHIASVHVALLVSTHTSIWRHGSNTPDIRLGELFCATSILVETFRFEIVSLQTPYTQIAFIQLSMFYMPAIPTHQDLSRCTQTSFEPAPNWTV